MKRQVLATICAAATLAGCVSMSDDPYFRSFGNKPQLVEFDDELNNKRLSYLGRYLVETDTRQKIIANTYNKEFIESWSAVDYGTMTSMITDLAVGDLGSSLGSDLGTAVAVGGMILGAAFSSDHDVVGQAWLPNEFNGVAIDSSAAAHTAFAAFVEQKMSDVAEQFGYKATCLGICGERSKVFLLERQNSVEDHPQWGHQPEQVLAMFNIPAQFEAIEDNDILPIIVREPVRWKLPPYFTFKMGLYSRIVTDETGNIVVGEIPSEKGYIIESVHAKRDMMRVPLGRMMMQAFHDTPYTFYANDDLYPSQLYFNGEVYKFFDGSNPQLMQEQITQQWGG